MKDKLWSVGLTCALGAFGMLLPACSGDDDDSSSTNEIDLGAPNPDGKPGDAQTPPTTNGDDVEAWLAKGDYKKWSCEMADHPQMKVSPHGQNRVCSNDLAMAFAGATDAERPVGTASVKELFDDSSKLVGYAVGVKLQDKSDSGANWYWYERVPTDSMAPHNSKGIVADGLGSRGAAKDICVGCHTAAGSNEGHTVMGSSDFVYLQNQIDLGTPNPDGMAGDAQTPPTTNGTDVEAWLATGDYKKWACEMADHPQMKVSPHGQNRVCSNALASGFAGKVTDERPIGTASVKELFDDSSALVGYAVGVKLAAKSDGGKNWYWYERVPLDSMAPHNSLGVVADGLGGEGTANTICVGCHAGAGSNADHTVMGSSDFVYLQAAAK